MRLLAYCGPTWSLIDIAQHTYVHISDPTFTYIPNYLHITYTQLSTCLVMCSCLHLHSYLHTLTHAAHA